MGYRRAQTQAAPATSSRKIDINVIQVDLTSSASSGTSLGRDPIEILLDLVALNLRPFESRPEVHLVSVEGRPSALIKSVSTSPMTSSFLPTAVVAISASV